MDAVSSTSSPPRFELARIREEIIDNWLLAEAKSSPTSTKRTAQYCCFTYYDGVKAYHKPGANWHWLDRELSSNVAGETGAVFIYKGALAALSLRPGISNKDTVLEFCQSHMENEAAHLEYFESIVPMESVQSCCQYGAWQVGRWAFCLPCWVVVRDCM
jgi:demethoxyubiquinone hydroxylase (CLK1/Coq7/Cat5 family)